MTPPAKSPAELEWAGEDAAIELCIKGEANAVERLFRAYAPMVQGVISRLVGPTPDFEDLVQTTFAEALGNLSRFRGEAKLSTWLCGIAVHVAHHHLRAGKVRRHVPLELVVNDGEPADLFITETRSADQTIDSRRLTMKLHRLLDRIAPKKRIALLLYVMEERSVQEIAALMKATQTATRSRMFFARRELRKLIASDAELRDLAAEIFERTPAGHA
jgi:RNA polymerase sigma-70 factor (ECF subfamily)